SFFNIFTNFFSFSTLASYLALSLNIFYYSFISRHHSFSYLLDSSEIFALYSLFNCLIHILYNSLSISSTLFSKFLNPFLNNFLSIFALLYIKDLGASFLIWLFVFCIFVDGINLFAVVVIAFTIVS